MGISKLILEVLRPVRSADIISLANRIVSLEGVKSVTIRSIDIKADSQSFLLAIEGENLEFKRVTDILEEADITVNAIIEVQVKKYGEEVR